MHLDENQEECLLSLLYTQKGAPGWNMVYIKGMDPLICTHCIALDDDAKPTRQMLCWLNPAMKEVVKSEVSKLLDVGIIYLNADSK